MHVRLVVHPDDRILDRFGMRMALMGDIWIPCRHMWNGQLTPALKFPIHNDHTNVPWAEAKVICRELTAWYIAIIEDRYLYSPIKPKEDTNV